MIRKNKLKLSNIIKRRSEEIDDQERIENLIEEVKRLQK